jgi:hypothetical protein
VASGERAFALGDGVAAVHQSKADFWVAFPDPRLITAKPWITGSSDDSGQWTRTGPPPFSNATTHPDLQPSTRRCARLPFQRIKGEDYEVRP